MVQLRSELEGVKAEDVELATGPVAIELKDFELVPNLIRVKAGETTFILNNTSTHTHNYRIVAWDDRKNVIYRGRPKVGAKKTKEDTLPLEPGVYYIYCNVSDHEERGMVGKLFVDS
ncbi:MAG: cupredoxin domain-containing protein [Anaerolineae bacterium]